MLCVEKGVWASENYWHRTRVARAEVSECLQSPVEGFCKAGCGRAQGGIPGSLNLRVKYIVGTGMLDWRTLTLTRSSAICSGKYQNILSYIVLVSLNIKTFLSSLIHILPVAQTGKNGGKNSNSSWSGYRGDVSCAYYNFLHISSGAFSLPWARLLF